MSYSNGSQARSAANGTEAKEYPHGPVAKAVKKKQVKPVGLRDMYKASRRPLPTELGDGRYRNIPNRPSLTEDLKSIKLADLKTLKDIVKAKLKGEVYQDDKTMIMERTIQLVSGMPNNSPRQEILTNDFIDKLWYSLDHPPMLYMGDQFRFRQPDGSNNNPLMPKLGAAGTPYSRSCQPRVVPLGALPDPEAVFESIMARKSFIRNQNNVSSILWYWATIIIHDIFWTNSQDPNINDSSSYLDLAPLYGHSQEAQDTVRTFKDGMLKPDTFADKRLLGMPPGVCVILIMFNRVHNYVAGNLAAINENNRFAKPSPNLTGDEAAAAWKKYDEELFQTARLVTSGLYINITLVDYVRNIINLNRADTEWTLDPRQASGIDVGTKQGSERGVGNSVSAEFNLCYRWHSCISEADEEWLHQFYDELLGENYGEMDLRMLMIALKKFTMGMPKDPGECVFNGYQRGEDGRFDDDDLVNCISSAIEQPGGSFGARNVPRVMKPVEMLGIIRGRKWHLAGLNEFRKHFGMKAYETFEDINSDPEVADALRNLYQHPDYVELYPGIVAEEAKAPMVPGVGITPTYTISRVVLSDAVALVRGDRHYTTDYNPLYLTNWGFKEFEYDLKVNHGCVFYKLFIRAFPDHFKQDSVYAHYPMVIPSENRKILTALNRVERFSFDRPRYHGARVEITTYGGAKQVLNNDAKYRVQFKEALGHLSGHHDGKFMEAADRKTLDSLLYQDGWKAVVKDFYARTAEKLLAQKSYKINSKNYVDVIRDIGNNAHTHFASEIFNIPLKTEENPKGVFSEQELYTALAAIFMCIFLDTDPAKSFSLRQKTKEVADILGSTIETSIKYTKSFGLRLFTGKAKGDVLSTWGADTIKGLSKDGLSASEIAWGLILPSAAAIVPSQGQLFAQALDWYLSTEGQQYREELHRLACQESSEETDALLLGYAMEGVRMAGAFGLNTLAAETDTITEDDGSRVNVNQGDRVFVSFVTAARDPAHFPNPDKVDPRRPLDAYIQFGAGTHTALGKEVSQVALVELFRAVFKKNNLHKAAGAQGELKKVPRPGGHSVYLTEDWGTLTPFPISMKVTWDD
ncbi:Linoleate 10R-lipoxygenase [Cladobotryum mycophilum]|uniref:Linoleate 10R-lipoxygenase n=1 Tax=Cladobotryum mycophilum TaxID=491253 RepID=A0ABR0STI6_9HYPO